MQVGLTLAGPPYTLIVSDAFTMYYDFDNKLWFDLIRKRYATNL